MSGLRFQNFLWPRRDAKNQISANLLDKPCLYLRQPAGQRVSRLSGCSQGNFPELGQFPLLASFEFSLLSLDKILAGIFERVTERM